MKVPSSSSLTMVDVVGVLVTCLEPEVQPAANVKFTVETGTSRQ